jgi:hypothetical protein
VNPRDDLGRDQQPQVRRDGVAAGAHGGLDVAAIARLEPEGEEAKKILKGRAAA